MMKWDQLLEKEDKLKMTIGLEASSKLSCSDKPLLYPSNSGSRDEPRAKPGTHRKEIDARLH